MRFSKAEIAALVVVAAEADPDAWDDVTAQVAIIKAKRHVIHEGGGLMVCPRFKVTRR